jgi:hypothetical protein
MARSTDALVTLATLGILVTASACATAKLSPATAAATGQGPLCPCPTEARYKHLPKVAMTPEPIVEPAEPSAIAAADCSVGTGNKRCGRERWCQKTLADNLADQVDFVPMATTIKELNTLPEHCEAGDLDFPRRPGPERTVYEVVGVIDFVKPEDDRDFHIVLVDLDDPEWHMVVEVVDPTCPGAKVSAYQPDLRTARESLLDTVGDGNYKTLVGTKVRVRGVGLYDRWHGQTGMAENCLELHPVIQFEVVN